MRGVVVHDEKVPRQQSTAVAPLGHNTQKLDFPPIENGVDYLVSVVEHLTAQELPGPRELKYAIVHLQAATEVLLKARLQGEHWSLVFKNPGQATRPDFEAGKFESCTTEAAITRLRNIAGINISDKAVASMKYVADSRNALQHYGFRANARAVESRAAEVLDFLMAFVHQDLLPALPMLDRMQLNQKLDAVRDAVLKIDSFLTKRENRLKGELRGCQQRTLRCHMCWKWALVVGRDDGLAVCHFCDYSSPGTHAAEEWSWILNRWPEWQVTRCPDCRMDAFLEEGVEVAAVPGISCSLCFVCGKYASDARVCSACGTAFRPAEGDDPDTCSLCLDIPDEKSY
jgi:hypothetical protein